MQNMRAKDITVSYFNISKESLDQVIIAWWVSRTEDPLPVLWDRLRSLSEEERNQWLGDILSLDVPIAEFVPVFCILENCPRAYMDQLDRTRNASYWEQGLRVKDLSAQFEYYTPPQLQLQENSLLLHLYKNLMDVSQQVYNVLVEHIPREQARGVIPLHINVRTSVQYNLRSLLELLRRRSCFFAQGDYWRPVIQGLLEGLWGAIPALKEKNILTLPCQRDNRCPYEKDLRDREEDRSNPVCPVLLAKFTGSMEASRILSLMKERYPSYVIDSTKYMVSVGLGEDAERFFREE